MVHLGSELDLRTLPVRASIQQEYKTLKPNQFCSCNSEICLYLRIVSILPVGSVSNDLCSSIGQLNTVFATRHITIANGFVWVLVRRSRITDGIVEGKWHSRFMMMLIHAKRKEKKQNKILKWSNANSENSICLQQWVCLFARTWSSWWMAGGYGPETGGGGGCNGLEGYTWAINEKKYETISFAGICQTHAMQWTAQREENYSIPNCGIEINW